MGAVKGNDGISQGLTYTVKLLHHLQGEGEKLGYQN
jgi:hypothetical protein